MASAMDIVKLGVLLFVAGIIFGNLEPTMKEQKVSGSSTEMNDTIDATASNTWSGLGLANLSVLIVGAVIILRYVGFL